jgi:hypothetical protein
MIAFALVGGLGLTACGNPSDTATKPLAAKRASSEQSTTSTTPFVDGTDHAPGSLRPYVGARSDVHDTTCSAVGDAWRAVGEVTNSTSRSARYRIYVSFLQGDTTVGIAESPVGPVKAGATADWSARVAVAADGLRCILRVERSG